MYSRTHVRIKAETQGNMFSGPSLVSSSLLLLSHWLFHDESVSMQSGKSDSCMMTLGLTGLHVGDQWLWAG